MSIANESEDSPSTTFNDRGEDNSEDDEEAIDDDDDDFGGLIV